MVLRKLSKTLKPSKFTQRGQKSFNKGRLTEFLGVIYLTLKGYRILKRRYKTPVGEIDIVAQKGNMLVLVEVKYRPTYEKASYALQQKQQRRLLRAAESLMIKNLSLCRFDCLLFMPWRIPVHLKNIIQKEWVQR